MPRPSRLSIIKPSIASFFAGERQSIYSKTQLANVLGKQRGTWELPASTKIDAFIPFLLKHTRLKEYKFHSAEYGRAIIRYSWGDATFLELALTFKPHAYLCHATALSLHGLGNPDPRTIYLNVEQSAKGRESDALAQEAINRAFAGKQRQSNLAYKCAGVSVVMISGKNTNRLGVAELDVAGKSLAVTNLERTLIDIVVRPTYAGGVDQLLKAYTTAKNRVSVEALVATLKKLNYIYPYHQSIGFLMQRAGYPETALHQLRALGLKHDFYLAHKMNKPLYSKDWRLYFPREWST